MTTSNGDRKIPDVFGHIQRFENSAEKGNPNLDPIEVYATLVGKQIAAHKIVIGQLPPARDLPDAINSASV